MDGARNIQEIIEQHALWLSSQGQEACRANLCTADLRYANLRDANLRTAQISGANLSGANLSYANLRDANLSYANLSGANLRTADLSGANLSGANLSYANFNGAVGDNFASATFGNHQANAGGGYISVGCERHVYQYWLDNYERIGQENGYTSEKIELYGAWIKIVVAWLTGRDE